MELFLESTRAFFLDPFPPPEEDLPPDDDLLPPFEDGFLLLHFADFCLWRDKFARLAYPLPQTSHLNGLGLPS